MVVGGSSPHAPVARPTARVAERTAVRNALHARFKMFVELRKDDPGRSTGRLRTSFSGRFQSAS